MNQVPSILAVNTSVATVPDTSQSADKALVPLSAVTPLSVSGKFFSKNGSEFYLKGVTYGTFQPDLNGDQYPQPEIVRRDFGNMVAVGINSIRVYTVPPEWLLELALECGLYVMVGIPWEQHIAVLECSHTQESIKQRFIDAVEYCKNHPVVFCYSIGNEIPASVVRWHGKKKTQKFLKSLYDIVKQASPESLVTYVNFPTTEFLNLDFVDFYSFNVYLESEERLRSYLPRLQTIAGNKPLLLAEVGLDSLRNGVVEQCQSLKWQIRSIYDCGAAGTFVFAWTDEWYVGGRTIHDWEFGLTTIERDHKPALAAVASLYSATPFDNNINWPSFTVVVCSFNGSSTIEQTLTALEKLNYPDFEVVVVNDGSTDNTAEIAENFPVTLISTENRGLSSARNTGFMAGTGELIAYIDDDAFPEPQWLRYLAITFMRNDVAGVGGPNYPVPDDLLVAECVANAPGGPLEVMLTDTIAEHIPGCNMSFRRTALEKVGGFDPQFRAAGDDVDLCWRIIEEVGDIGFQPAAFNWHRRRNSISGYWKQQKGYGIAEALLQKKWPLKYNTAGYVTWQGRVYGQGFIRQPGAQRERIYQGVWGSSPFQRLYRNDSSDFMSLTLMPEWIGVVLVSFVLFLLGVFWTPLLFMGVPFFLTLTLWVAQAFNTALSGQYEVPKAFSKNYCSRILLTALLSLMQPVARFIGRSNSGLSLLKPHITKQAGGSFRLPVRESGGYWDGNYQDRVERLTEIKGHIEYQGVSTQASGDYDDWDLQIPGGLFGSARLSLLVEHHGEHSEFVRYRIKQGWSITAVSLIAFIASFASMAFASLHWIIGTGLTGLAGALIARSLIDSGRAACLLKKTVQWNASKEYNEALIGEDRVDYDPTNNEISNAAA